MTENSTVRLFYDFYYKLLKMSFFFLNFRFLQNYLFCYSNLKKFKYWWFDNWVKVRQRKIAQSGWSFWLLVWKWMRALRFKLLSFQRYWFEGEFPCGFYFWRNRPMSRLVLLPNGTFNRTFWDCSIQKCRHTRTSHGGVFFWISLLYSRKFFI